MLHLFLKISFLLSSLGIHGLNAEKPIYAAACNGGMRLYTGGKQDAACRYVRTTGEELHYNCQHNSCLYDDKDWVPFNNCRLANSANTGVSFQKCKEYNYEGQNKGYTCSNLSGVKYVCPEYNPQNTVGALTCLTCRAGNW
ncbi:uncharacterized protein MELLADRAFT_124291 [Melampsora larici-populina 98AG31]|uniref:Secreted protein n=1 Tax=Melampsora larici-populina (strain 98AG31 / pathotype 3-4-7) TaxID=747676 RepID=F4RBE2_MELLP|nr:uncharacterized protein MELLADRAFT_124291 [Melampsora larici-populina 98AG31]EGG10069.1 secreted protein [Melampsora larici-populina 98AG31]